jgi:hypothetical protein
MRVRAKMKCDRVTDEGWAKIAKCSAIYGTEGENKDFADATPSGSLELTINRGRPAADVFKPGQEFYVDITPVDEA